jgi:hypothetical protein
VGFVSLRLLQLYFINSTLSLDVIHHHTSVTMLTARHIGPSNNCVKLVYLHTHIYGTNSTILIHYCVSCLPKIYSSMIDNVPEEKLKLSWSTNGK